MAEARNPQSAIDNWQSGMSIIHILPEAVVNKIAASPFERITEREVWMGFPEGIKPKFPYGNIYLKSCRKNL